MCAARLNELSQRGEILCRILREKGFAAEDGYAGAIACFK